MHRTTHPWFFYVPFHAVHTPLVEKDPQWSEINSHIESADRRLFASALSHLDAAIGNIVETLDRTGQRDRTLIVFTSDNGAQIRHRGGAYPDPDPKLSDFSSNEPLRGEKCEAYEGAVRVPAFLNWPGVLEPGSCDQMIHAVDWMPTLQRLAGANLDSPMDGREVWPQITGTGGSFERTLYTTWGSGAREALHRGNFKIVRNGRSQGWQLFDLEKDPSETINLAPNDPVTLRKLLKMRDLERELDVDG